MGRTGRRLFLLAGTAVLAAPLVAAAQPTAKVRRIGILTLGVGPATPTMEAFRNGLRELGYVEGRGVALEYRFANGKPDQLAGLAAEMARLDVDVILTDSTPATLAAKQASPRTPIVMTFGGDPVEQGLAASLRRPGGNVTGLTLTGAARSAKQLEILKDAAPKATLVAVMYNVSNPNAKTFLRDAEAAAQSLSIQLRLVEVRAPADLEAAFRTIVETRPSAFITLGDAMLWVNRERIGQFAVTNRLPTAFPDVEFVEAGGLMSYGPSITANFHRAASFVDKILKGAKPGDLPIEQPTRFELVINLKTAKALGLRIPPAVLARADRVIE